jgi:hypothetical protein
MKSGIGLAVAKGCSTNALQLEKINHLSNKKKLAQYPTPTRLGPTRISIAIGGHDPANSLPKIQDEQRRTTRRKKRVAWINFLEPFANSTT